MCVSEWRVPLMNVTPEMIGQAPGGAHRLLRAETVQDGHDRGVGKAPAQRLDRPLETSRLGRDDAEVERRDLVRIGRGVHRRLALAAAADAQAVASQRRGVILAPRQHGDVGDGGQMAGEEAADRTCAYDAHPLHPCRGSLQPSRDLIKYRDCDQPRQRARRGRARLPVVGDLRQPVADGPELREQLLRGHARRAPPRACPGCRSRRRRSPAAPSSRAPSARSRCARRARSAPRRGRRPSGCSGSRT